MVFCKASVLHATARTSRIEGTFEIIVRPNFENESIFVQICPTTLVDCKERTIDRIMCTKTQY